MAIVRSYKNHNVGKEKDLCGYCARRKANYHYIDQGQWQDGSHSTCDDCGREAKK